jgi:hypothetical protein
MFELGLLRLATVAESAFGTKRTWRRRPMMSAFWGKADIRKCGERDERHASRLHDPIHSG